MLIAALTTLPLRAEMGGDDYRSPGAITDAAERQRLAQQLERERAQAAEAEVRRESERQARAEAERQRRMARPPGERLVEARCSACHRPDVVDSSRHTPLGWRLVVERMRWWHGADVPASDVAPIVGHLAATFPAPRPRAWLEWSVLAGACTLPLIGVLGYRARRRRRAREERT